MNYIAELARLTRPGLGTISKPANGSDTEHGPTGKRAQAIAFLLAAWIKVFEEPQCQSSEHAELLIRL
jgi:hypothetical protein